MKNIRRSNSPFSLDSYGTRVNRSNNLYRPDSIYSRPIFSNIAVLAFVFIDFFCLFTVWNLVQTEDMVYVCCVALGCAVALDVPLAIAAIALKRYHNGLSSKKEAMIIMAISVSVFAIAFVFSLIFRLVTKDLSFDTGTSSTLVNTVGEMETDTTEDNLSICFAALFNGVIPLLTSLSSFVISYFSSPLNRKLKQLETERITLQSNILEVDKALAQAEDALTHCDGLLEREQDLYFEFIDKLDSECQSLKQLARIIIMEKLQTPENVTALTESGNALYSEVDYNDVPNSALPEFVSNHLVSNKNSFSVKNSRVA